VLGWSSSETAEEWLLTLEQAERNVLSSHPRPLLEREPLLVWRSVALFSLLLNLVLLVVLLRSPDAVTHQSSATCLQKVRNNIITALQVVEKPIEI
jgi:hypothetical protein